MIFILTFFFSEEDKQKSAVKTNTLRGNFNDGRQTNFPLVISRVLSIGTSPIGTIREKNVVDFVLKRIIIFVVKREC